MSKPKRLDPVQPAPAGGGWAGDERKKGWARSMEDILEVKTHGIEIPAAAAAEMGWGTGTKILLRRTGDGLTLHSLAMSAQAGAMELQKDLADLRGEMVTERDTGEIHRLGREKDETRARAD